MNSSGRCAEAGPSAAEANEAIRRFVAGRVLWPPEALAELARLRRIYLDAVARETWTTAA